MNSKLVLSGQRGVGKSAAKSVFLGIFIAAVGLMLTILYFSTSSYKARDIFGQNGEFILMFLGILGGIMLIGGIAVPFLAGYQAKKCYIDVYEGHVKGAYLVRKQGSVDQYVPFELEYSKIQGVSCDKNKVFLQLSSGSVQCLAYNAQEICQAIRSRL